MSAAIPNKRGFTLIELIIVMVVVAIVGGILYQYFTKAQPLPAFVKGYTARGAIAVDVQGVFTPEPALKLGSESQAVSFRLATIPAGTELNSIGIIPEGVESSPVASHAVRFSLSDPSVFEFAPGAGGQNVMTNRMGVATTYIRAIKGQAAEGQYITVSAEFPTVGGGPNTSGSQRSRAFTVDGTH
jgi:prepilin-type N-terminal cleavage/methylation domain-containing protein